jgi:hypothetical protein
MYNFFIIFSRGQGNQRQLSKETVTNVGNGVLKARNNKGKKRCSLIGNFYQCKFLKEAIYFTNLIEIFTYKLY